MRWASACSNSPTSRSTSCSSSTPDTTTSTPTARSTRWRVFSPAIWIRFRNRRRYRIRADFYGRESTRSECLIGLADLAADAGKTGDGRLIFVVDIKRLGVGTGGLVFLAEPLIGKSAAGPGLRIRRVELYRVIEIVRRRLVVVDGEVRQRARKEQLFVLLIEPDRRRKIVDGELMLALKLIEQAAVVIGF